MAGGWGGGVPKTLSAEVRMLGDKVGPHSPRKGTDTAAPALLVMRRSQVRVSAMCTPTNLPLLTTCSSVLMMKLECGRLSFF